MLFWEGNAYKYMSVPRTVEPSGIADDGSTCNPHPMVYGNVAPNEQPKAMRWLRKKPMQVSKATQ